MIIKRIEMMDRNTISDETRSPPSPSTSHFSKLIVPFLLSTPTDDKAGSEKRRKCEV